MTPQPQEEWTPGPWAWDELTHTILDARGLRVAALRLDCGDETTAEGAANAHLIASAPSLAAEAARLREFAADMIETTCWGRYSDDVNGGDLQDAAIKAGLIVEIPGGFDPDKHHDESGCAEPGDRWFEFTWERTALTGEGEGAR